MFVKKIKAIYVSHQIAFIVGYIPHFNLKLLNKIVKDREEQ